MRQRAAMSSKAGASVCGKVRPEGRGAWSQAPNHRRTKWNQSSSAGWRATSACKALAAAWRRNISGTAPSKASTSKASSSCKARTPSMRKSSPTKAGPWSPCGWPSGTASGIRSANAWRCRADPRCVKAPTRPFIPHLHNGHLWGHPAPGLATFRRLARSFPRLHSCTSSSMRFLQASRASAKPRTVTRAPAGASCPGTLMRTWNSACSDCSVAPALPIKRPQ
mmetsp:Transcript_48604/g.141611  ORF Transcript_48604/g.141611 Transcript_48604/m.141611 type:complete len:223 (-) Transcript_48604:371-1039(-)